ncbi:hypothetical protein BLA24_15425 [Streptomyces cinnamoneus]|uniref:GNAT family N-acetyltransferase n=1 Tax=Streptomyces cinnamoneus TaxID=53446 RepID=A0A2G1XIV2_STRCJ|nr:hypothetical protein [Streptomyces cinnamoneus]PHQ51153.1 hypothetical protein BLA24_15425 [Streptomyces cinnamoneus]PPT13624.1 hypothetical protein CYQ11_12650 [Streptomyces cinnamoneus]
MDFAFVETPKDVERDCFVYTARSALDFHSIARMRATTRKDLLGHPLAGQDDRDDVFVPHAVHMLTVIDGDVVAAAELVVDSPLGLPVDARDVLTGALRKNRRLVQFRRLVLRHACQGGTWPELPFGVVGGMVKACLQWSVLNDMSHVVVDAADCRAVPALERLGFAPVPAGAPAGGPPPPLLLRVSELASRSFRSARPFYRYLMEFDESVLVENFRPTLAWPLPPVLVPERTL